MIWIIIAVISIPYLYLGIYFAKVLHDVIEEDESDSDIDAVIAFAVLLWPAFVLLRTLTWLGHQLKGKKR